VIFPPASTDMRAAESPATLVRMASEDADAWSSTDTTVLNDLATASTVSYVVGSPSRLAYDYDLVSVGRWCGSEGQGYGVSTSAIHVTDNRFLTGSPVDLNHNIVCA